MTVLSEMNLTNLLDTALVLVLALLMVTPVMKQGISVALPTTVATGVLNAQQKTMTIIIAPKNVAGFPDRIYVDDVKMTPEEVAKTAVERLALYPKLSISIDADKDVGWERVAQVMAALKSAGIENVDLPTEPEKIDPSKYGEKQAPAKSSSKSADKSGGKSGA